MMKKKLLSVIVLFISVFGFSQPPHRGMHKMPDMKSGIVGRVVDKLNREPVEYANIAVFDAKTQKLVGGTISNEKGFFAVKNIPIGVYNVKIKFIGYVSFTLNKTQLTKQKPILRLKPIEIERSSVTLDGVEVTGKQNEVVYKIDKRVVNVSENVNTIGGTAVDALENTPGVEVDIDGNVSLRGSDNFTVLIDGKPTVLEGNEALQQIPASSIKEIELITNPSAKYDPDGLTGIINVILKKDKKGGVNGLASVSAGNHNQYSSSVNLNYRKNKYSITAGYDFRQRSRSGSSESIFQTFFNDSVFQRNSNGERERIRATNNIKLGFDYDFDSNNILSINGQYRLSDHNHNNDLNYLEFNNFNDSVLSYLTSGHNKENNDSYDITTSFVHKFPKKGHELQFTGTYSNDKSNEDAYTSLDTLNVIDNITETLFKTDNTHNFGTFQADYVYPFSKLKFEAGVKTSLRQIDYNQTPDLKILNNSQPENQFQYNENIYAAYAMLSGPLSFLEYKIGLRAEYSDVTTLQKSDNEKNSNKIFTIYPTAHISFNINETNKLQLSYSRRVHRPRTHFLNPFEEKSDPFLIRKGNPNLKPEYANSLELNYLKYFDKSFISLTVYSRITNGSIGRIQEPINQNTLLLTFENLNKETSSGIELSGRHRFTKWLQVNANYSYFRYTIDGVTESGEDLSNESNNSKIQGNASLRFTQNSSLQIFAMYFSPSVTAQGSREAFYFTGLGYKHLLLDKRLTISARVRNPLGNFKWNFTAKGTNFNNQFIRKPDFPSFTISLTYRINKGIRNRNNMKGQSQDFSDDMSID